MNLSPIENLIPNFGGAETLIGFDTDSMVPGQPLRGKSNRQLVRFYIKKVVDFVAKKVEVNEKTGTVKVVERERRETDREMVNIVTPGEKNIVDDFAQDYHRRQFFRQYKAFRDGRTAPMGMPIEEATFISSPVATELRYLGVHTVEQLADAGDLLCNGIADGYILRDHARALRDSQSDNQALTQVNVLRSELEKSQKEVALMQEQMKSLLVDSRGKQLKKE